jgi:fructoselysine 6-kinase
MRLLALGDNTIDTYVDRKLQYPGGNPVSVAVMTKRLGVESHYLGCVGSDECGDLLLSSLAAEGVERPRVRRRDQKNARAFIGHRNRSAMSGGGMPAYLERRRVVQLQSMVAAL